MEGAYQMSSDPEDGQYGCQKDSGDTVEFDTIELLSLYTTMKLKDIIVFYGKDWEAPLAALVKVIKRNIMKLGEDKKEWFFSTTRDFVRIHRKLWRNPLESGQNAAVMYNTLLLITALETGIRKPLYPDGYVSFSKEILEKYISKKPAIALKVMDQGDPLYELLVPFCPYLEEVSMPLSDNARFVKITKLRNLRIIEMAGGVTDKLMCNALWNIDKKSEKVLQMVLKEYKDNPPWQLALPHLEVLRSNLLQLESGVSPMKVALGAAALIIQPKLHSVETLQVWHTFHAIKVLLNTANKIKGNVLSSVKLAVTHMYVTQYSDYHSLQLRRVVEMCPKLHRLSLKNTTNFSEHLSLFAEIMPFSSITWLSMDATNLTDSELFCTICKMPSLRHLTLCLYPNSIADLICPIMPEDSSDEWPLQPTKLESLRLEFYDNGDTQEKLASEKNSRNMVNFLAGFPNIKELYLFNTVLISPSTLVHGCIGGAVFVLENLTKLSIISCQEGLPKKVTGNQNIGYHYCQVATHFPNLRNREVLSRLKKLQVLEIDELYISYCVDQIIEALRLCEVQVTVVYRPNSMQNVRVDHLKNLGPPMYNMYFSMLLEDSLTTRW